MDSETLLSLGLIGVLILFLFFSLFMLGWSYACEKYRVWVFKPDKKHKHKTNDKNSNNKNNKHNDDKNGE